jgi:hypothetical protein
MNGVAVRNPASYPRERLNIGYETGGLFNASQCVVVNKEWISLMAKFPVLPKDAAGVLPLWEKGPAV